MSTGHRIREWVKYLRHASTRHSVHSPFVFDFVENGLRKKMPAHSPGFLLVTTRHKKLISRIIHYFQCRNILWLTNKEGEEETFISISAVQQDKVQLTSGKFLFDEYRKYPAPDMILFDLKDPEDWLRAWNRYKPYFHPEQVVLIPSIHHTAVHTETWDNLRQDEVVTLSIDLYKTGILLFRKEFAGQQHFVLRHAS